MNEENAEKPGTDKPVVAKPASVRRSGRSRRKSTGVGAAFEIAESQRRLLNPFGFESGLDAITRSSAIQAAMASNLLSDTFAAASGRTTSAAAGHLALGLVPSWESPVWKAASAVSAERTFPGVAPIWESPAWKATSAVAAAEVVGSFDFANLRVTQAAIDTSWIHEGLQQAFGSIRLPDFSALAALSADLLASLPDNLDEIGAARWAECFEIGENDGLCLAYAPRADVLQELLDQATREERAALLMEHRDVVLEDVEQSLAVVDHHHLTDLKELTVQAVTALRDGHDFAAQALLGNVIETAMKNGGGQGWLETSFPAVQFKAGTGHGTRIMNVHAARPDVLEMEILVLVPYMLVTAMKEAFRSGTEVQDTFNRHLAAHSASMTSYRTEFAVSALLTAQALLRQLDLHLYAQEDT
ncbi:hypothetical protein [Kitasatospora sp. NPDC001175]|uniref:hypothetical protein n=1 Tax=Kitasatospora sp. NPDC001175 TaxID=3157103 RepID=UPI003D059B3A